MTTNINAEQLRKDNNILTYGAIVLPYATEVNKPDVNPKEATKTEGKLKSALKDSGKDPSKFKKGINTLKTYLNDARNNIAKEPQQLISKYSGIAVARAIVDNRVTCKSATDYLFLGFAPALGIEASALGYSGINQMKDALTNGSINVGSFIDGFSKTLKAGTDLKDQLQNKTAAKSGTVIEFDLTMSHNEAYQSESPDRRVEDGTTYSEVIHNLPETFDLQCALQEDKRYSKETFRSLFKELRANKKLIKLVLGDEVFEDLILTNFSPATDCTKSGFDYTLSFKHIIVGTVDANAEVTIQKMPEKVLTQSSASSDIGNMSSSKNKEKNNDATFDPASEGKGLWNGITGFFTKVGSALKEGTVLWNATKGTELQNKLVKE